MKYDALFCGDNIVVIRNITISDIILKNKQVSITYHITIEAYVEVIVRIIKISGGNNFSNIPTN